MKRNFEDWLSDVNAVMLSISGVTIYDLPPSTHPYDLWWATGSSPNWAAREILGVDNG